MTSMVSGGGSARVLATPTAISMFPEEHVRISRRWAQSRFGNLVHFDELDAGGHFAAFEQPAAFVAEVRDGPRGLRKLRV